MVPLADRVKHFRLTFIENEKEESPRHSALRLSSPLRATRSAGSDTCSKTSLFH